VEAQRQENQHIEKQMLDFLHKKDQEKTMKEEHKKSLIKQMTEASVHASAADKQRVEEQKRLQERMDRERFRDDILRVQEEGRVKTLQEKQAKHTV
jgi:hypothetical protein